MRTDPAAVGSRLVDVMNLEDSRPTTLLEGDGTEEALSSISTIKIESRPSGAISRAVICNPVGKTIDAPYVIHDDAGLILLHLSREKPDYLTSIARNLSKTGGTVRDASQIISRVFERERDLDDGDSIVVRKIGIEGNYCIKISSGRRGLESSEQSFHNFALSQGGLTYHHLRGNYLPQEIGLAEFVKLQNGCYPGQEIHARLDSRNPITKRLVRVRCDVNIEKKRLVTEDGKLKIITPFLDDFAHAIADKGVLDGRIDHRGTILEVKTIHSAF